MLNVDGEALKGDSKALYKGNVEALNATKGTVNGDRKAFNGDEE